MSKNCFTVNIGVIVRASTCQLSLFVAGETCESVRSQLLSHMTDGFEDDISPSRWQHVSGGSVGLGCGALLPLAHGKNLYFNGCGLRHAVTAELDLTRARSVRISQLFLVIVQGSPFSYLLIISLCRAGHYL